MLSFYTADRIIKLLLDTKLIKECNFKTKEIKSIRGIGYEKEDNIYNIKDDKIFNKIMDLIEQTSTKSEIIEMCGHAMYITNIIK